MPTKKILVIDDEDAIKVALKKALKNEGYKLIFVSNGKEGLTTVKKEKPDLIFLDLRMPVMGGIEFLEKINIKHDDSYAIVIITGHGDDEDLTKCYDLGVNNFLRKPLSIPEICAIAKRCLLSKETEAELKEYRQNLEGVVDSQTKKIQEQLVFTETLLNSVPAPIYIKDKNLNLLDCNAAFATWIDKTKKQIIGKKFADFFAKSVVKKDKAMDKEILADHEPQLYNGRLLDTEKLKKDVCICKAVYKNKQGKVAGIIGTIFDITEREQALKTVQEKSDALNQANMSLRILIKQLSDAQEEERTSNIPNLKELVMPGKEQLEAILSSPTERSYIDNIMLNLNRVTSTFAKKLSQKKLGLSPKEIQVADLIRIGLSNKEAALQMNVTKSTIEFHRDNLRKKLELKHQKKNLRAFLMAMDADMQDGK